MDINVILGIYSLIILVFGTIVAALLIRDLITGRYKRLKKFEDDFDKFEQDVQQRRKNILGDADAPKNP